MDELALIDRITYQELKNQMGADFMVELIDTYISETGDLIAQLQHALAAGDASAFGRLAHSIKSSSASLGALAFSKLARELEMMGKASDLSGAGARLERLESGFIDLKNILEELKNEP